MADIVLALKTRRDWIVNYLNDLDETKPGGRPDAVGPGLNLQETAFRKSLYDELTEIEKKLASYDVAIVESEEY